MGEHEGFKGQLDQAKSTDSNDLGWIKHVLEDQPANSDAKQQRQNQTDKCVEKGLLPGCSLSADSSRESKQSGASTDRSAPQVSKDSAGRITSVEHANGVKYDFSGHDKNGQPTSIKITRAGDKDSGEWKKEQDGLWRAYHNGKPTSEVIVGEWQLNGKGELSHTGHQEMRPVSSEKIAHYAKDGSGDKLERTAAVTAKTETQEPKVARNANGKVTEVTRSNGETTQFKYAANGRLTEVKLPGGTTLTSTDGYDWHNSETGKNQQLTIKVQNDGTYSIRQGDKKVVLLPNGNSVRMDVVSGSPDRVTSVTDAKDNTTKFGYSADGKLNEVTLSGGTVLTTKDGGKTWANSETGKTTDLKVEVQSNGTYSLEQGGKKAILIPDGSEVRKDTSGGSDRVTSVTHADGRSSEFKYGPDGKLNELKMPGGTVYTTTDAKVWVNAKTGETTQMRVEIGEDGSYTVERDGKMGVIRPDGSGGPFTRSLEEPGKVKEKHAAGSRAGQPFDEVVYEDGTVRQYRPGGTTVDVRKDMTVTQKNDHSVTVDVKGDARTATPLHPERGVKSSRVDESGNVIYKYDDGTSSVHMRGGGIEDIDKKGNSKLYLNGVVISESKKQADGSTVDTSEGHVTGTSHPKVGRTFLYDDQGNVNEVYGKNGWWKKMASPDGKEYWQNQDDPNLKWNGKMTVDKAGNVHFNPDDPNAPSWIFTRDGREIPQSRRGHANTPKDQRAGHVTAKKPEQRREPISVDTSVPIPRDIFDREGTPATIKR